MRLHLLSKKCVKNFNIGEDFYKISAVIYDNMETQALVHHG